MVSESKHKKRTLFGSFFSMGLGLQTLSVMTLTFLSGIGQMNGKSRNCVVWAGADHPKLTWEACEKESGKEHGGDSSVPHGSGISLGHSPI